MGFGSDYLVSETIQLLIVHGQSNILCSDFKLDLFCDYLVSSLGKMNFILRKQSSNSDHGTGVFMFVFIFTGVLDEKKKACFSMIWWLAFASKHYYSVLHRSDCCLELLTCFAPVQIIYLKSHLVFHLTEFSV